VTRRIRRVQLVARLNPLHPLMIVMGIVLMAVTAKLGHGMWGVGGMLAFYPTYLAMLIAGARARALLVRMIIVPQVLGQPPVHACRYVQI
jgi:hypothetical protein